MATKRRMMGHKRERSQREHALRALGTLAKAIRDGRVTVGVVFDHTADMLDDRRPFEDGIEMLGFIFQREPRERRRP